MTRKVKWDGGAYRHEMTDDDHRELAQVLRSVKGMVIISGYGCELYDDELYPDWRRVERQTYADGDSVRTEVLWLSPKTTEALDREKGPIQAQLFSDSSGPTRSGLSAGNPGYAGGGQPKGHQSSNPSQFPQSPLLAGLASATRPATSFTGGEG